MSGLAAQIPEKTGHVTNPNAGTLIITSAIHPPANMARLCLIDPGQRLLQTYCSLIRWIRETHITSIVLCDNTGTDHAFSELASMAERYSKTLEVLVFKGNHEQACLLGKGYGEGEIMKHVMEHSRLLQKDTAFYKVTGRIFVEGFNALHQAHAGRDVVFSMPPHFPSWKKALLGFAGQHSWVSPCLKHIGETRVATTFYKCTRRYYMNNLVDQYRQVAVRLGYWLEHAMLTALLKNGFDVFSTHPCLVGHSGSTGRLYDGVDYSNEVKDLASRLLGKTGDEAGAITVRSNNSVGPCR